MNLQEVINEGVVMMRLNYGKLIPVELTSHRVIFGHVVAQVKEVVLGNTYTLYGATDNAAVTNIMQVMVSDSDVKNDVTALFYRSEAEYHESMIKYLRLNIPRLVGDAKGSAIDELNEHIIELNKLNINQ